MEKQRKCLVVVRVRGAINVFKEISDTLEMLHLHRNCHATLIDDRPSYLGMLRKTRNYVAWGEVSKGIISFLLKERGRLIGNKKVTEKYAQEMGYKSIEDLALALHKLEVELDQLPSMKPVFRLRPPKKGYKGKVKKSYSAGGVTGYRGESINDLLKRMI